MNTTSLISNWSMAGAREELQRRYAPSADILAAVADEAAEPSAESVSASAPAPRPLMVKPAGADDWQPLPTDA